MAYDKRITAWHWAFVMAVIQLATTSSLECAISVSRKRLMEIAHIHSIATYHKVIRELKEFGYLIYEPSYHPGIKTQVLVNVPEPD